VGAEFGASLFGNSPECEVGASSQKVLCHKMIHTPQPIDWSAKHGPTAKGIVISDDIKTPNGVPGTEYGGQRAEAGMQMFACFACSAGKPLPCHAEPPLKRAAYRRRN